MKKGGRLINLNVLECKLDKKMVNNRFRGCFLKCHAANLSAIFALLVKLIGDSCLTFS